MKITILSASTGGGHMSAANAIKDYFVSHNVFATVVDAIEYISPVLNKTITEIYEYIATKQPKLWKMVYNSSNNETINRLVVGINSVISKKLLPLLESSDPDLIISTHPFTTEMVSTLKLHKVIDLPLICVMTDYAPHRTWISPEVNAYVVANSDMVGQMVDIGVKKELIYPFGIPVDDSFHVKQDKNKILEELSLDPSIPTILIMAGKGGFANIDKIYSDLQNINLDFQIIVITGKNEKLYNKVKDLSEGKLSANKRTRMLSRISKYIPKLEHIKFKVKSKKSNKTLHKLKNTKIIFYTNEVEKYMSISDLIITKPGGLTVSEALACGLPMALFNAIPGQEEENANFLVSNNMAVKLEKDGAQTIKNLLENPKKLSGMKKSCEEFDKSDSLKNILALASRLTAKEKHFNKLVRDKIPEIILSKGDVPETEILSDADFLDYLNKKLLEEAKEVMEAKDAEAKKEEIADLLEVIYEIASKEEISLEDVEKVRIKKRELRGGFSSKILLKKVLSSK